MPTILILAVAAMGLVLVVLAVVVVGTRQEPFARSVRRMLGVYVRRPDATVIPDERRGEPGHTARGPVRQPDGHAR